MSLVFEIDKFVLLDRNELTPNANNVFEQCNYMMSLHCEDVMVNYGSKV